MKYLALILATALTGLAAGTAATSDSAAPPAAPARRAAPVLVTVPGQLYDVDPSRSSEPVRVASAPAAPTRR